MSWQTLMDSCHIVGGWFFTRQRTLIKEGEWLRFFTSHEEE
jgi:hypothetical protein